MTMPGNLGDRIRALPCGLYVRGIDMTEAEAHKQVWRHATIAAAALADESERGWRERIETLEGVIHSCPTCGEMCKQCRCVEARVEALERERDEWKAGADAEAHAGDEARAQLTALQQSNAALLAEVERLRGLYRGERERGSLIAALHDQTNGTSTQAAYNAATEAALAGEKQ